MCRGKRPLWDVLDILRIRKRSVVQSGAKFVAKKNARKKTCTYDDYNRNFRVCRLYIGAASSTSNSTEHLSNDVFFEDKETSLPSAIIRLGICKHSLKRLKTIYRKASRIIPLRLPRFPPRSLALSYASLIFSLYLTYEYRAA